MTTSSDHRTPAPRPSGDHWLELTATLSSESKEAFAKWLGQELDVMIAELDRYVTPNSLQKSLRR